MGRAIAKISEFEVTADPKTTFNAGRVGGGTSVNAIPFDAWMEVDMRSSDKASLEALDKKYQAAVQGAVDEENRRWKKTGQVTVANEIVGLRPAGSTPLDSLIVKTAVEASVIFGYQGKPGEGSTDSSVPMNPGIPAVTIGGGGRESGSHALDEAFDWTDSYLGTQRALVLAVAMVQQAYRSRPKISATSLRIVVSGFVGAKSSSCGVVLSRRTLRAPSMVNFLS